MAIWLRAREEFADNRFQLLFICGLPRENVPYRNFFKKYFIAVFARSMQDVSMGQSARSYPFPFLRYSMENVLAT